MNEEVPLRDVILDVIRSNPGIHFREIQRRTGAAVGQVEYHLYQLEKLEKIHSREDGKTKRYFTSEGTGLLQRRIIFFLRNPAGRDMIFLLLQKGRVPEDSLVRGRKPVKERKMALLEDMIRENVLRLSVESETRYYELSDVSIVRQTLKTFRESFLDTLTSNIISILDSS